VCECARKTGSMACSAQNKFSKPILINNYFYPARARKMPSAFSPFTRRPAGPRTAPLPLRSWGDSSHSHEVENAGEVENPEAASRCGPRLQNGRVENLSEAIESFEDIEGAKSGLPDTSHTHACFNTEGISRQVICFVEDGGTPGGTPGQHGLLLNW